MMNDEIDQEGPGAMAQARKNRWQLLTLESLLQDQRGRQFRMAQLVEHALL